jgi:hypothetical protein
METLSRDTSWNSIAELGRDLELSLSRGDVPVMVGVFARLLSAIVYDDHAEAVRESLDRHEGGVSGAAAEVIPPSAQTDSPPDGPEDGALRAAGERFYRSILHAGLWMSGAIVAAEKHENIGRTDLEAVYGRFQYVIEMKMADDAGGGEGAVRAGMSQIREKGYGASYRRPFRISLAIGRKERNIVACRFERDGHEAEVELKRV